MILKLINSALILVAVFMGLKQGYAMFSGKPEMLEMFSKWNFSKTAVMINGAVTMIAALLILFPKTFVWGNFLMAAGILMIICLQLLNKDLKGAAIEIPFLLLNLVIIYLQHPLTKTN
ncbi:DoxX family protein [Epilithonimonas xixisoli]|uniref:DoxX-like protein n=1 Tax=Epilithonimonas xixisoli TaxID=1476462 RepID=A0A4R8I869_9FLAO|nr:DoxX family protein [Epilithonimonas xixisoli]TDX86137.1 DoxX-like protein [Epilithonimonas xixisoli]